MFKKQQEKLKSPEASSSKSTQDTNLASPPEASSSSSPTKASGVSESERMTLGDAKKAQKRAAEDADVDDDNREVAVIDTSSPKKKAKNEPSIVRLRHSPIDEY